MRLLYLFPLLLFSASNLYASNNLNTLKKQAYQFQKNLIKQSKQLNEPNYMELSATAYYFYKNKDCRLASNIQKKLLGYKETDKNINVAFDWYRLSLYSACANDKYSASKAIFLAWELEQEQKQKLRYKLIFADYLFYYYQLESSWTKDIGKIYKEIKATIETQLVKEKKAISQLNKIDDKLKQLEQIKDQKSRLIFSKIRSEDDNGQLKICLKINLSGYWNNEKNKALKLEDYVRVKTKKGSKYEKAFSPGFEKKYNGLCLLGANWSTKYQIEILKGLSIDSKTLHESQLLNITTLAREADFWFKTNRYILSKNSTSQVPIYAVNTDKIHIALYRILPKNLQNKAFLRLFKKNFSNYELKKIGNELGNKVWSSDVVIEENKDKTLKQENITQLRQIPLPSEYTQKPGVYILIAAENKKQLDTNKGYENLDAQWLFTSDVGLTSYSNNNEITVLAHSLETGKSLPNLHLALYSKNNTLLESTTTDIDGKAMFVSSKILGKNGLKPIQIVASHEKYGFLFYPLQSAGFDLSDRGVSGRLSLSSLEAYLYTERGIYRPGEKVNLISLLRDDQAKAVQGLPLTLKISNPDGRVIKEVLLKDKGVGSYHYEFVLPLAIRTGRWVFETYADIKAPALGRASFLIEEIKPPRMQASLTSDQQALSKKHNKQFTVQADYLFGAPAANLKVKSYLSFSQDRTPFTQYKDFVFGVEPKEGDKFQFQLNDIKTQNTDKSGNLLIDVQWSDRLKSKNVLQGLYRAEVIDFDGTAIAVQKSFRVLNQQRYVGIGKSFKRFAPIDTPFSLNVLTLDELSNITQSVQISWKLIKEESYFQWFNKHGNWSYEKIIQDKIEVQGSISKRSADTESLSFKLKQGQYRLEVFGDESTLSSYRFNVGEQVNSINDLPDVVKLTLDKPAYHLDEEIELTIDSPYKGEADIIIADNKIHSILKLHLTQKQTKIKIPVNKSWGVGSYALVSVYRGSSVNGTSAGGSKLAKRAMGVIWINRDKTPYKLDLEMTATDKIKPKQQLPVTLSVADVKQGEDIYVTLAAVEKGVLNLTGYKAPKPLEYFLAKRQLETKINDNYARLINNIKGKPAQLREGGGAMMASVADKKRGRVSSPAKNINIVSLFSGIVKLDKQGKTTVVLNIPDFNGQLSLMAVAYTADKTGAVQKDLQVADDMVVQIGLPRFMSKGDKTDINLQLHNLKAPAGEYQIKIFNDDLINSLTQTIHFTVKEGASIKQSFTLIAKKIGNAKFHLVITGPNQFKLQKNYNVGIRGVGIPVSEKILKQLAGNSDTQINSKDMSAYESNTVTKTLSLSSGINLGVYSILEKLESYPHGCLEQVVSRAMPLLSTKILSKRWNYPIDPETDSRINEAIILTLDKQRYDGSFTLWTSSEGRDGGTETWLSMYAMEFLLTAKSKSYRVPEFYIKKGLQWVENLVKYTNYDNSNSLANIAYAHLILAKAGSARVEDARYLAKHYAKKLPSLLSIAQLSQSLKLMGEDKLATKLISAIDPLKFKRKITWQDYGSQLRDIAGFSSVIDSQHKSYSQAINWLSQTLSFPDSKNYKHYLSTQEQAWLIRLALTLGEDSPLELSLDGKVIGENQADLSLNYSFEQLINSKQLSNTSNVPIWINKTIYGQAKEVKAASNGFEINKALYNEKGEKVNLANVKQGQRYIMLIEGRATTGLYQRAMIMDLLAAGLEIENANISASFDLKLLKWLPKLSIPRYSEALDDRYVAAIDIPKGKKQSFSLAYPVRATSTGKFNFPAVYIEDMYQPYFRANTTVGIIDISSD